MINVNLLLDYAILHFLGVKTAKSKSLHGVCYARCTTPPILTAQRTFCPPLAQIPQKISDNAQALLGHYLTSNCIEQTFPNI